jgi:hypothetical protein
MGHVVVIEIQMLNWNVMGFFCRRGFAMFNQEFLIFLGLKPPMSIFDGQTFFVFVLIGMIPHKPAFSDLGWKRLERNPASWLRRPCFGGFSGDLLDNLPSSVKKT